MKKAFLVFFVFALIPAFAVIVVFGILFMIRMLKGAMGSDAEKLEGEYKREEK